MLVENNPLALSSVSVTGLYGYMTCTYKFDCQQPISILLGPNGSGKTTILNLLKVAFNGGTAAEEATIFAEPIFQEMTLIFSSRGSDSIRVKYTARKRVANEKKKLSSISVKVGSRRSKSISLKKPKTISAIFLEAFHGESYYFRAPTLQYISANRIVDQDSQEQFSNIFSSLLDVSTFNSDQKKRFLSDYKTSSGGARISNEFNDAIVKVNEKIQFLHDRVYDDSEKPIIVDWFLASYLADGLDGNFASLRSLLANSKKMNLLSKQNLPFIKDLIEASASPRWSRFEEEKTAFREAFIAYRGGYSRFRGSRISESEGERSQILPEFANTLTLLFSFASKHPSFSYRSIFEQLQTLLDWQDCFSKLVTIFQDVFPNYHPLLLHYDYGSGFMVTRRGSKDRFDIDRLSSGQLNSLIMFFELLKPATRSFSASSDIYLIDEPEISLHISWQQDYVDELLKLVKKNTQIIIATHSPFILASHKELLATVDD